MTTTLERPTAAASPVGPARNGRRALVRWAWRLYRREWRQQILAVALLIVAVAATTVGLGLVGNVVNGDKQVFGTANSRMDIDTSAPGVNVAAEVAQAQRLFGTVETIEHATIPIPGSVAPADVRAEAQHGPFSWPQQHITAGSYPSGPGQVAVTSGLAATFHLKIGSTWQVNGHALRVVAMVENPTDLQDDFALVAPGQLESPHAVTMLFNSSRDGPIRDFRPAGVQGLMTTDANSASQHQLQSLLVLVLSTIGMVFVGLLAVAGFTVMAQRRMRSLGMVGAIGATDRQVRLVILANGVAVGVVGAVVGTAAGLAAWFGFRPAFEHLVGHRIDAANVQWWAVAVDAVLAVLTAVLAAWWPARAMSRLPIVAALSGRPASPRPAHRFALAGCALLGGGFGLLVWAQPHATPILVILGIVTSVAGMLLIAPLGIRVAAAGARRAPVAIRLALRDLGRYQARSGAALAAVSLAIGIAATIAVNAEAQNAQSRDASGGNLPQNQVAVSAPMSGPGAGPGGPGVKVGPGGGGGAEPLSAAQLAALHRAVAAIAGDVHATATATLQQAVHPGTILPGGTTGSFPVMLVQQEPRGFRGVAQPLVATPDVLAMYHIAPSALTGEIVTSMRGLAGLKIALGPDPADLVTPTVQVLDQLPTFTSAPNTLITAQYAAKLGLQVQTTGYLLQSSHPLTAAEVRAAVSDAAAAGVVVESRDKPNHSLQQLRDYSTGIGILVALGVLMMTVGLIRSETANDLRTLTAAGATGATRRTLTSATAGTLALLGGLLGTAGCYLALLAWNVRDLGYLSHPPVWDLLALVLALPVAAIVIGWLTAVRPPTHLSQRPMD